MAETGPRAGLDAGRRQLRRGLLTSRFVARFRFLLFGLFGFADIVGCRCNVVARADFDTLHSAVGVDGKKCGMGSTAVRGLRASFASRYCGQSILWAATKAFQAFSSRSPLMLMTTRGWPAKSRRDALDFGKSFLAGAAPGGPEIEQDDLAVHVVEFHLAAIAGDEAGGR